MSPNSFDYKSYLRKKDIMNESKLKKLLSSSELSEKRMENIEGIEDFENIEINPFSMKLNLKENKEDNNNNVVTTGDRCNSFFKNEINYYIPPDDMKKKKNRIIFAKFNDFSEDEKKE